LAVNAVSAFLTYDLAMEGSMEWTGGCLCGATRFRVTADPVRVVSCHCGMRRRHSGAAFLTFVHFPVDAFIWVGAAPTRFRSSKEAERGFCARCGSILSMHESVLPDRVQVTLGSLDDPGRVRPDDHVWTESQLPWLKIDDDRPRFRRSSTAVPSRAESR
jgi:hypothetical protein